jgi:hypothetical protein
VTTYSVKSLKHNISTVCEVKTRLFYIYKETVNPLSIVSNIKFEHRISLNYNLKKCHDLEHLSLSLNGANQINMSKLDKRLPKNDTKFGDHPSNISVGDDVQKFFYI